MPVATRRRAPVVDSAAEIEDPEKIVRKKPSRTATTAKTANAGPDTKTSTRSRRIGQQKGTGLPELNISTGTKSTNTATSRAKKETTQPEVESVDDEPERPSQTSRSTRAGSVRDKTLPTALKSAQTVSLPPKTKLARQTRATTSKPQPLSPKKITQVSKPKTQNPRNTEKKAPGKVPSLSAPTRKRGPSRGQGVSDENADVQHSGAGSENDDGDDEIEVSMATSTRSTAHRMNKNRTKGKVMIENPTSSKKPSFVEISSQMEVDNGEPLSDPATDSDDDKGSDDELNGPKTPMRRCSPSAEARYHASVRNTIRKLDYTSGTSTSQETVHGISEELSATSTPVPNSTPAATNNISCDEEAEQAMSDEEPSFYPDENIIMDDFITGSTDISQAHETSQLPSPPISEIESEATIVSVGTESINDLGDVEMSMGRHVEDSDETIVIHDPEDAANSDDSISHEPSEVEDTVLIVCPQAESYDAVDMCEPETTLVSTDDGITEPETLIWENIRQDETITINFDDYLSNIRPLQEPSGSGRTSVDSESGSLCDDPAELHAPMSSGVENYHAAVVNSRRETINLNEFIDVTALVEPTQSLVIPEQRTSNSGPDETELLEVDVQPQDIPDSPIDASATQENEAERMVSETHDDTRCSTPHAKKEVVIPHYARSTFAFESRRKSLPAFSMQTPTRLGMRPHTSDGASIPRMKNPFVGWPGLQRLSGVAGSTQATPSRSLPRTSDGSSYVPEFRSHVRGRISDVMFTTPVHSPRDRRPRFAPRNTYEEHPQTIAAGTRFRSPVQVKESRRATIHRLASAKSPVRPVRAQVCIDEDSKCETPLTTPRERRPLLAPRETYEEHAMTVAVPTRFRTPVNAEPKRRETIHQVVHTESTPRATTDSATESPYPDPIATPLASPHERYPRLTDKTEDEQLPQTVAAPDRFRSTPSRSPIRRAATARKSDSLRKAAIRATMPRISYTPTRSPVKTPLKLSSLTPSQEPMTPHPAAPLRGIVALVEVYTLEGASASAPFVALLLRLGGKTTRNWNERITHVIFKDGSPTTLQRVRLHNKDVAEQETGTYIHCVNSRWVADCDTEGIRKDEFNEAYAVDVTEVPRGGKRRRKSMEPSALLNLNGNVVRDRKSSLARSSLSRSPFKQDSPSKRPSESSVATTPLAGGLFATPKDKSWIEDSAADSPETPAWIAAPEDLVQQTAPMNRVRKLELTGPREAKNRRLTFWHGPNA